jgi:multicomponent K+:H+ antiporter subunit D
MSHLLLGPIVIPVIAGALLLMLHRSSIVTARAVSTTATVLFVACAVSLFAEAADDVPRVYALGNWPAPFGIVLVGDRLAAWMVLLTAMLASGVLVYAVNGWDRRGRFFHAFFQFQLMGLAGAFLTGDLFNLFVFFEVMLIASYCLMLQGLGEARLRATLHYVAINLTASGAFLLAVSLLYGVTGTLNIAHLAARIGELSIEQAVLARAAGLLLIGVFCVKAALFPLYFWLPAGYANAAAPVAALFSIMTKVGVYSIVRVTTIVYGGESGAAGDLLAGWLLPLALVTLALGAMGAFAAERLTRMIAYLTIASVGTMLAAIEAGGSNGLAAAIYYAAHSTLAVAILFLVADLIARQRAAYADVLHPGPRIAHAAGLGLAFLVAGAAVSGLPPTSGFLGKLMVLQSVHPAAAALVWPIVLGTSFMTVVACVRAGSLMLWNVAQAPPNMRDAPRSGEWLGVAVLGASSILLVAFAAPLRAYAHAAAAQLASPGKYVDAVLGPDRSSFVRPMSPVRAP